MLVRRQASPLQNVMIEIVLVHQTTIKTYSVFQVLICVFNYVFEEAVEDNEIVIRFPTLRNIPLHKYVSLFV